MKSSFIILFLVCFLVSCSSVNKTESTEGRCVSLYKNDFRNIVIDKFTSVVGNDTIKFNEVKFQCVFNSSYTKKGMYDRFGKWDQAIYTEGRLFPILLWKNVSLFPDDSTKFTVVANGLEHFDVIIHASVMVFDSQNNDLLSEDSVYKEKLIEYFSEMIRSNRARKKGFYEVYPKLEDLKR